MQLVVGRVGRPHGIRGELTVEVRTDDPDNRLAAFRPATEPAPAPADDHAVPLAFGRLLLTFARYGDRTAGGTARHRWWWTG